MSIGRSEPATSEQRVAADAKAKLEALPGVEGAEVEIVWDPAWNPRMISEEGRKQLGLE